IVAGPAHTLVEAFAIAARTTGIPAPRTIPPALLRGAAELLDIFGQDAEPLRVMAGTTYLGTSAKAERDLGFTVRPLEQGLAEMLGREMERVNPARTQGPQR